MTANPDLIADFHALWDEAAALWDAHQNDPGWGGYVSADYAVILQQLLPLRGQVTSVLEWGSGLGVVTIMASRLGFDAFGIESEPVLVDLAYRLAEKYGPAAKFAEGSFIPDEFPWDLASGDEAYRTDTVARGAYDQLDMELRDFDLVYAYPWPEEFPLFHNIIRKCGRDDGLLLTYNVRDGLELTRFNES
jgi:hypothetical protein